MRRPACMAPLCALALFAAARPARADLPMLPTHFDVATFRPTPGPRDLIIIPQTQPLSHLSVAVGSYFSFVFNPLQLVSNLGSNVNPISNRVEWDVMAAVGIYDWLEIGAILPVVLFQSGSLEALGQAGSVQAQALGDFTLVGKVPLLKRLSYAKGFGAALSLRVDFRTSGGVLIGAQVVAFIRPNTNIPNLALGPQILGALGIEVPVVRRYGIG